MVFDFILISVEVLFWPNANAVAQGNLCGCLAAIVVSVLQSKDSSTSSVLL